MGQLDKDPIPPWAITCWSTDTDIIILLPMTSGAPPYMMRLPLNEGGLSQALELLKKRKREILTPTEAQALYAPPKNPPQVKVSARRQQFLDDTTEEQRANARKVLAKLGIK
jgi:hypothetical protein